MAWTHFGNMEHLGDMGATYPHRLLPSIKFSEWWPEDPLAKRARQMVRSFAYGYFLSACEANPSGLLPLGGSPNEALVRRALARDELDLRSCSSTRF